MDQPRGAASCAAHRIGDPLTPTRSRYDQLQGHGNDAAAGVRLDSAAITNQGLIISANEIFWISAAIFILLLGLVWFARPPFSAGEAAARSLASKDLGSFYGVRLSSSRVSVSFAKPVTLRSGRIKADH